MVGGLELGGAAALLVPRLTAWAGSLLVLIMLAALVTVLVHPGSLGPSGPLVHLAFLAIVVPARWSRRWRPGTGAPRDSYS